MKKNNLFMLSLSMKAGKLVTGEQSVEIAVKKGSVYLMIVPADASENTKNKFINKGKYYNIPVLIFGSREELSHAVGKFNRTVFAVTDEGLARRIYEDLSPNQQAE
ncbi:MAG: ribosomal L7Ae/L30e/S12e/Gadd45 family protein [Clostridiales bacterium]|nr:ribosomal L7Ae/L30e/S12e/Gadd45 family protein [Clostridiales bacterium]